MTKAGLSLEERWRLYAGACKPDTCWLWTGALNKKTGAGALCVDKRPVSAFKIAHVLFVGPVLEGEQVSHSCRNSRCVNPAHLFIGTHLRGTPEERFWAFVGDRVPDTCWTWLGALTRKGYGQFWDGKRLVEAHRFAFTLAHDDPGDLWVLHGCDNPPCVNATHLHLGTAGKNSREMVERERHNRGEDRPEAKLTEAKVAELRIRCLNGEKQRDLAFEMNVSRATISRAKTGKIWSHVTSVPPIPVAPNAPRRGR